MVVDFLFLRIEAKAKLKIGLVPKKKRNKKVIVCKHKR